MDILKMFGPMGGIPTGSFKGKDGKSKDSKMIMYDKDVADFIKWGAIGFVGMGVYQLGMRVAQRNINPSVDLEDRADSINLNPIIRDSFVNLQSYRSLNPWLFRTSLQNVDHLLFLENALLTKQISPSQNDKAISFSHFRMGVVRLNQFQLIVKDKLGNSHAMAVNIFVKKIYDQIQKHFLNVLHICSRFNPGDLVARAQQEIDEAMKNYKKGERYGERKSKWEKFLKSDKES
jgi:hypothetical protein